MSSPLRMLGGAWRLFRTDSRMDSYLAALYVLLAVAPFVFFTWQLHRSGAGGGESDAGGVPGV